MELELDIKSVLLLIIIIFGLFTCYLAYRTSLLGEDSALYLELEEQLAQGKFPSYLRDKPMALPFGKSVITALFFVVFGPSLGIAKVVVALFGLGTMITVFLIGRKLNPDDEFNIIGFMSALLLFSAPLFGNFSLIAYTDIPITFFSALTLYLLLLPDTNKKYIILGIISGVSYYFKQSGLLLPIFSIIYLSYMYIKTKDKNYLKYALIVGAIAGLILAPWVVRNLILFEYPYFEVLNPLFAPPKGEVPVWLTPDIQKQINPKINYLNILPVINLNIIFMGLIYYILTKDARFNLPISMSILIILFFIILGTSGIRVVEDRYYLMMFPQISLIGGLLLSELKKQHKLMMIPITILSAYLIFTGYNTIINVSRAQRFPSTYLSSLAWLKLNSVPTDKVFTAYSGSVRVYSGRATVWNIDEFPEVMKTDNSTYIYEIMNKYDVKYIIVWSGILSPNDEWIIPSANLFGAFTNKFLNNVQSDVQHFKIADANTGSIVFEVIQEECKENELGVCEVG